MKFSRMLAAFLILALASSSALAAVCAASCASLLMQEQVLEMASSSMDMHDCHQADSTQQQPETEHQNCTMAGCHFSQVVFDNDFKHQIPDLISVLQPVFISTAISADQPPPIKPPA